MSADSERDVYERARARGSARAMSERDYMPLIIYAEAI